MRFSERMGFQPVRNTLQIDLMDDALRNGLWNVLTTCYWQNIGYDTTFEYTRPNFQGRNDFAILMKSLWINYFKRPLHELPSNWKPKYLFPSSVYTEIQSYFFKCEWYEVYDFVEFIPNNYYSYNKDRNDNFMCDCNAIMERELSAYRFVNGKIAQITSEEEISSIEEATVTTDQFKPVSIHLEQALEFLADRKSPNYRNSIKESISAVESMCKLISQDNKATLAVALRKMEPKVTIHPALKKAFDSLYGYTNDADGIRHALLDESDLKFEDAKFMLVTCSAFINYLKAKLV